MKRAVQVLSSHPNTCVFAIGLTVLCASVSRWSGAMAGAIAGLTLMAIAVKPFLAVRKGND